MQNLSSIHLKVYIAGLAQDCGNSRANALELPQFVLSHEYNIHKSTPDVAPHTPIYTSSEGGNSFQK